MEGEAFASDDGVSSFFFAGEVDGVRIVQSIGLGRG